MEHQLRYVAVEGPPGSGKSALARRLASSLDAGFLSTKTISNPFLEEFYRQPEHMALPTQLQFLMSRRDVLKDLAGQVSESGCRVSDFLFVKDRLFAGLTLEPQQLTLYHRVASELEFGLVVPDLVIYLQAPLDMVQNRMQSRADSPDYSRAFAARLHKAYTEFFHRYNETAVLIVNASDVDGAQSDHDYQRLLRQIKTVSAGRHYFNPGLETV